MNRTVLLIGLMVTAPLVWILASGFGNDPHTIDSLGRRKAPTLRSGSSTGGKRSGSRASTNRRSSTLGDVVPPLRPRAWRPDRSQPVQRQGAVPRCCL